MNIHRYTTAEIDDYENVNSLDLLHKIIASSRNPDNLSVPEYRDHDISDNSINNDNNLITDWLLTMHPDLYFSFVSMINNRITEIQKNSYVQAFPENRDGLLALAIFLEFAATLQLQPLELYMLLDDPLEQSLNAVLSYQMIVVISIITENK